MRKFFLLVAVGALALLIAAPANALEFKFGAEYRVRFYDGSRVASAPNVFLDVPGTDNPRGAQVRIRPRFDVKDDNGNIQATLRLEIGDVEFGNGGGANGPTNLPGIGRGGTGDRIGNGSGGGLDVDGVNVETKWAYLDAALPFGLPARVRAGIQPWYLPKALLVDTDATGVRIYGQVKPISYDLFWYRALGGLRGGGLSCLPNAGGAIVALQASGTCPAGTTAVVTGTAGLQYATSRTIDNNYDFWGAKVDLALAPIFNPGVYYLYGRNASIGLEPGTAAALGIPAWGVADTHYIGATVTGKAGIFAYDLDFIWGSADGGTDGYFPESVRGWVADGAVHFPIGPVTVNLAAVYATGDKRDGGRSEAFPGGPNPSWNGPGGGFELIGSGGPFDAVEYTQDSATNIWALGGWVTYNPVKALTLKAAYAYIGFARAVGNCAGAAVNTCYGPSYFGVQGRKTLGHELSFRADYQIWTGFLVQGELGWLLPTGAGTNNAGVLVGNKTASEYILQLLYNF